MGLQGFRRRPADAYDGGDRIAPAVDENGLPPSSTNRAFIQQMVYAVGMETYERFVRALGRDPGFGPLGGAGHADGKLRVVPAAFKDANAYYDRDSGALKFGYATAERFAKGPSQPGALVYTALCARSWRRDEPCAARWPASELHAPDPSRCFGAA